MFTVLLQVTTLKLSLVRKMVYFVQWPTLQLPINFFHASSIFLIEKIIYYKVNDSKLI